MRTERKGTSGRPHASGSSRIVLRPFNLSVRRALRVRPCPCRAPHRHIIRRNVTDAQLEKIKKTHSTHPLLYQYPFPYDIPLTKPQFSLVFFQQSGPPPNKRGLPIPPRRASWWRPCARATRCGPPWAWTASTWRVSTRCLGGGMSSGPLATPLTKSPNDDYDTTSAVCTSSSTTRLLISSSSDAFIFLAQKKKIQKTKKNSPFIPPSPVTFDVRRSTFDVIVARLTS